METSELKTRVCLFIIVVANVLGNVVLRHGMKQVGSIAAYSPIKLAVSSYHAVSNPYVAAGVALLVIFFLAQMIVLSWADLSYILPMTSMAYILVTVMSWWFLGETVRPMRWLGTLVITAGVILVGRTPVSTTLGPAAAEPAPAEEEEVSCHTSC
ncbi:MAG TPA: EamA family transporter [Bryobacterales bacterium]|nr:EamA family transporter [Bryobacterales bacterium]